MLVRQIRQSFRGWVVGPFVVCLLASSLHLIGAVSNASLFCVTRLGGLLPLSF
jgi:hypothetical protein